MWKEAFNVIQVDEDISIVKTSIESSVNKSLTIVAENVGLSLIPTFFTHTELYAVLLNF